MGGERDLRVLLRGLREVRQTKAREGMKALESTYMQMNGLGLLEITELRGFASAVVDGLRRLEATREENKRGEEEARLANGGGDYDDNDDDIDTQGGLTAGRSTTGRSTIGRSTVVRSSVAVRGSTVGGGSSVGPRHYDDDDDDF